MICDTFMFYNEFDVLELRLECLDRYVDRFVLVEAEVNHVGGPKPLYFNENKERYAKWLHKIEHVIVKADEAPKDENPWAREKYQRECVIRGLEGVPNESIVMISDGMVVRVTSRPFTKPTIRPTPRPQAMPRKAGSSKWPEITAAVTDDAGMIEPTEISSSPAIIRRPTGRAMMPTSAAMLSQLDQPGAPMKTAPPIKEKKA